MGRIRKSLSFLSVVFIIIFSCKSEYIPSHPGKIDAYENYTNPYYDFYIKFFGTKSFQTDTIDIGGSAMSKVLKKHVKKSIKKDNADFVGLGKTTVILWGNYLIMVYLDGESNDLLSSRIYNKLSENRSVRNLSLLKQINFRKFCSTYSSGSNGEEPIFLFGQSGKYLADTKINMLTYDIESRKKNYAVTEIHIPLSAGKVARVIAEIDIENTKQELFIPETWQRTFDNNFFSIINSFEINSEKDSTYAPAVFELFNLSDKIIKDLGYKAAIDSIRSFGKNYSSQTEKNFFYQVMMTLESFQGNNKKAIEYEAKAFPKKNLNKVEVSKDFKSVSAKEYILNKSKNYSVVLLNEAHNRAQHRSFIRSMLKDFASQGFSYLLVEALNYSDTLLNVRKYPIKETGFYIQEPAFGQMIREALDLGFKVLPYDDTTTTCRPLNSIKCRNNRERNAAENILQILKKDKNAKVIVAAGHDHIFKKSDDNWIRMGETISKISSVVPLSVDLVRMTEEMDSLQENEYYRYAQREFELKEPTVLINNLTDSIFLEPGYKEKVDIQVFFPKTTYVNGLPTWYLSDYESGYSLHSINLANENCGIGDLLQVYVKDEMGSGGNHSIPFLQTRITKLKKLDFYLPKKYKYVFSIDYGQNQRIIKSDI